MAEFEVFDQHGNLVRPEADNLASKPTTAPEVLGAMIGSVAARVRDRLPAIGLAAALTVTSVALAAGAKPQEQPSSASSPDSASSK